MALQKIKIQKATAGEYRKTLLQLIDDIMKNITDEKQKSDFARLRAQIEIILGIY